MKITSKQYAELLYEITDKKEKDQISKSIKGFVKFLVNNNDSFKNDKIIKEFQEIWNRRKRIVKAEIESVCKLDKLTNEMLNKYISELSKANEVIIKEKIDKDLLGGVIIRYRDKVLDGSLRTRLTELNNSMIK